VVLEGYFIVTKQYGVVYMFKMLDVVAEDVHCVVES